MASKPLLSLAFWLLALSLSVSLTQAACPPALPSGTIDWSTRNDAINASVTININQSYVISSSPKKPLGVIFVSGSLYVQDGVIDINTHGIVVGPKGKLIIGTKDCPITKKVTITLVWGGHLGNDTYDKTDIGYKGIVSKWGGSVQMHGYVSGPSWTRLSATAYKGSKVLELQEPVKWVKGDNILIASTDFSEVFNKGTFMKGNLFPDQHEVRSVVSVNGKTVTLNESLVYNHWGLGYERAEVGLLSKRILIQGDEQSLKTQIGGHFMLRYGSHGISGVELYRMGQYGSMGRYPLHFHLARFVWDLKIVVSDSVVHDAFQRCYVVHETHGVTLQNNIAYNSKGHCYFLEDGGEHGNKFIKNWGARILPMDKPLLLSDNEASTFWVSHPNNTFIDNVASGGYIGFWFVMPEMPVRIGGTFWKDNKVMSPRYTASPPGGYQGNVMHGMYANGVQCSSMEQKDGSVSPGWWRPTQGAPFNVPVPSVISNFTVYKVRGAAVWTRGCSPSTWTNLVIIDSGRGFDAINGQSVMNSTFIGRTANKGLPNNLKFNTSVPAANGNIGPIGGLTHYDVGASMAAVNCTYINFTDPYAPYGAWAGSTNGPGWDSPPLWITSDSVMINSAPVAFPKWYTYYTWQGDGILDDGSMTGVKGGSWIMGLMPHFSRLNFCKFKATWPGYLCDWFNYGYNHIGIGGNGTWVEEKNDKTKYTFNYGEGAKIGQLPTPTKAVSLVPMGKPVTEISFLQSPRYNMGLLATIGAEFYEVIQFDSTTGTLYQTPGHLKFAWGQCTRPSTWNIFSVAYPKSTTFSVTTYFGKTPIVHKQVSNFAQLSWNTYWYNSANEHLYLLIASDSEQGYGGCGAAGGYGNPIPANTGQYTEVKASCGDKCVRSGKAVIAEKPTSLPTAVQHDSYRALLTGPNGGHGTVFFQLYPSYRNIAPRLAYQVYHNIKGVKYQFSIFHKGVRVSPFFKHDTLGTSYIVPLTRDLWNFIVAGAQLVLTHDDTQAKLLTGDILLNSTTPTQWKPVENTLTGACKPSYETIPIYNGTAIYGVSGFGITTDLNKPICDGKSISFAFGLYDWGFKVKREIPAKFVSLEFFARSNRPDKPFELQVGYIPTSALSTTARTGPWDPNLLLDNQWKFYRIPLSALKSNSTWSKIQFQPFKDFIMIDTSYNVSFSQVRFSTQAANWVNTFQQVKIVKANSAHLNANVAVEN